jgi:hypothetical protein
MFNETEARRSAPLEAGMARVFTAREGSVRSVAHYGDATFDTPVQVPAIVGVEMARATRDEKPLFRVEFEPGEREAGEAALLTLEGVATPQAGSHDETTDAPKEEFHAEGGKVWHDNPACTVGNDIEPSNRRSGKGRLRRCEQCKALAQLAGEQGGE